MTQIFLETSQIYPQLLEKINSSQVFVLPTETVYGLCTNPYSEIGVDKLLKIKRRDPNKSMSLVVGTLEHIDRIAYLSTRERLLIEKFFPGPLTLVLKEKPNSKLAKNINSNSGTIGVRMPDHPFTLGLLRAIDMALVATSVNISGEKPLTSSSEIIESFGSDLDFIVDGGESKLKIASTVLDCTNENEIKVLRQGSISFDEIMAWLKINS